MSRFDTELRITEIFHSLQGESTTVGLPTVFVRLTGCPLRCRYCDTAYAFHGGNKLTFEEMIHRIEFYGCQQICITGGEPLAQPACSAFMKVLCDKGYQVSIETSGARDISSIDHRVMIVMDLKTPDSDESDKNLWENIPFLKKTDQIKFVICSREDYLWAKEVMVKHDLSNQTQILFSPSWGQIEPGILAEWILEDQLNVRFQIQLHKILWNNTPGR